jgi:hypothetical protein
MGRFAGDQAIGAASFVLVIASGFEDALDLDLQRQRLFSQTNHPEILASLQDLP